MEETHLIRTRNNTWKLVFLLILPFDNGFDDAGMIRAQVDEAIGYASLKVRS